MSERGAEQARFEDRLEGAVGIPRAEILYDLAGDLLELQPDRALEYALEALKIVTGDDPPDVPGSGRNELRDQLRFRLAEACDHLHVELRLDQALSAASEASRRAASRSAAQLAAIVENAPNVAILGTDIDGIVRFWNQATETITGWTAEEAIGRDIKDLVIPLESREEHTRVLGYLDRKSERLGPRERRALRKDGSGWTGLISSFTTVTEEGDRLIVHIALDVTEQVRLAEALRLSEERFSKAFFASPNSVTLTALDDGRFIEVNEGFEQIFGVPRQEALGKTSLDLGVWRHASDRALMIEQIEAEGRARLNDVPYRHASGQEGFADVAMERIEVAGEECLLTVVRDITAQKKAEEELRAALAEVGRLKARLEAENVYLQEEIRSDRGVDRMIGSSEVMTQLLTTMRLVARTDATVLILGETGTGKELVARSIHDLSARRDHTLVKVNCAAMSAGLVESELFGHVKGAFTGAERQRQGRFELADGGSIFLDEIGELPPEVQVKLLRVLQEQEFERIGSNTPLRVDVRVIAVTNRDLAAEVEEGLFRADLYYRLNVFPIVVPPLRDRAVDIPELAESFLERVSRRIGKRFHGIRPATLEWMTNYGWPGNVRELANFVERAAILAEGPWIDHRQAAPRPLSPSRPSPVPVAAHTLDDVQRAHVLGVLERCRWRIEGEKGAAAALGMNPSTLRSRMKKLGISRD